MDYHNNGPLIQRISDTPQLQRPQQSTLFPFLLGALLLAIAIAGYYQAQNKQLKKQLQTK